MKIFLSILLLFFSASNFYSQTFSVSGKVIDIENNPLVGVNVIISRTDKGAATNLNGEFQINNLNPGNYELIFSSIGYESVEKNIEINNSSIILNVQLVEKLIETDQIIITAGKHEQKISDLPVSAAVIGYEDISKRNISNIEDAMRFVPGVNMVDGQISIRGSSGYSRGAGTRVLLAFDGIPFYTGDTGEVIWESIPVNEIERVEIIKGAASSLYGSGAIGGVINIITKDISKQPLTYFKGFAGVYDKPSHSEWDWSRSFRTFNGLTISHSNSFNNFGFTAALTRIENNGYKQSGFVKRYIGYLKAKYKFSSLTDLTFFANTINQNSGNFIYWKNVNNALVPPDADQGQRTESNRYMFGLLFNNSFNEKFSVNIRSSYYGTNWRDETTSRNNSTSNLFRTEVQANFKFSQNITLTSGIEGTASQVNSNIFGNPSAKTFGIYSQADIKLSSPFSLSIGARFDYSKIDSIKSSYAFSPRIGLNYKLSDKIILRTSAGAGFRAPSLAEAFTSTAASGIVIIPNLNIKSEHNFTSELGINYQASTYLNIDAAIFHNEFYDYIEPELIVDNAGNSFGQFKNVTRARIQGLEFSAKTQIIPEKFFLSLGYTYLWARDVENKKALKYRPKHLLYASADYKISNFIFGTDFRYWSKVEEIDFNLARIIPDAEERVPVYVLDFRIEYKLFLFGIPGKLSLNNKNALNYNYVELIGNIAPIRNYSLSLEFLL